MLVKLLKYDLKYMIKNMIVFYLLSFFFAITTRILFHIEQSVIVTVLRNISIGFLISMAANILINTMMRSWIRFRDSLYKDESYLTHTLPVTKNDLYLSKFILTFLFFFLGFIVILLCLFLAFYSKENWMLISKFVKNITIGLNMSTIFFVTMFILVVFLEFFNAIQCGFYGIILGHRKNNGKIGYSVFYGFLFYLITQMMVLGLVFIYGLFDPSIMALFKTATVSIDANAFKTLLILASTFYLGIIFIMFELCKKALNKGVNVE